MVKLVKFRIKHRFNPVVIPNFSLYKIVSNLISKFRVFIALKQGWES